MMSVKFWWEFWTLVRFSIVGIAATVTYMVVTVALVGSGIASPAIGSVIGFCASFLVSYFGHFRFTFVARGRHRDYLLKFAVNAVAVLFFSTLLVWLFASVLRLDYRIAVIISATINPVCSYILGRFWIFLHPAGNEASREPVETI
jgi:putative flippase GtrA